MINIVDHSLDLPPAALMGPSEKDPRIMRVCSYCPGAKQATAWCHARGYAVTHGVCPVCYDREMAAGQSVPTIL
jgi:hypothetical protein